MTLLRPAWRSWARLSSGLEVHLRTRDSGLAPVGGRAARYGTKYPVAWKMTPIVLPLTAQYMKSRLPPAARGTVRPLARSSRSGKLIVEVDGSTPVVRFGATLT